MAWLTNGTTYLTPGTSTPYWRTSRDTRTSGALLGALLWALLWALLGSLLGTLLGALLWALLGTLLGALLGALLATLVDAVRLLAACGHHPAVLLLPAVIAMEK